MTNLWQRLAGVTGLFGLFIEGEGGAPGGGDAGGGGGASTGGGTSGGGGGDSSTASAAAPPAAAATGKTVSEGGGAPISTQETTSQLVDETGKPVRELGEAGDAFLARHRAWRDKQTQTDATKTPEQIAAETKAAADAKAATEKAAAEAKANEGKTPEQIEQERKAAEEKAAADAKAAQAATVQDDFEDFSPVPTEKMATLAKDPEFQKLLEKHQLSEGDFFATSRLADDAVKHKQIFATLESAQHAKIRAAAFHQLDDSFTELKAGDIDGTSKFVNDVMLPLSYLRDPETGKPMIDKDTGLPQTDGSAFVFLDNVVGMRTGFIANQVEKVGGEQGISRAVSDPSVSRIFDAISKAAAKIGGDRGEQLQLAADLLKGCGKAGSPSGDGEMSEEVKARLAEADRVKADADGRQKALDEQEATARNQRISTFKDEVLKESSTGIDKTLGDFLDRTSLKDDKGLRPYVMEKIRKALYANMSSDPMYLSQRDDLTLGGINKTTHAKWVALNLREAKARLKAIADPILAEAGGKKISRAQERQTTITEQGKQSQMETKGGTTTSLPRPATTNNHELIEQARQNLAQRGEDINASSLLAERRKLMAKVPA